MIEPSWGLLGPEVVGNERRTRTLGVGASVRSFNDLAVPGLGGVWFAKQLFLATLGVALAERVGKAIRPPARNIETANAVEALACWFALDSKKWRSDPRVRGATKMRSKTALSDLAFSTVRKPGFYVSQPMRMATVQSLPALGLVDADGGRFSAFSCSTHGHDLIEAELPGYSDNSDQKSRGGFESLVNWAISNTEPAKSLKALSTRASLSKHARNIVRERLAQGSDKEVRDNTNRRRAALDWVESIRDTPSSALRWKNKPAQIAEAHWRDLQAGALFFSTRDTAIRVLDALEFHIGNLTERCYSLSAPVPDSVNREMQILRERAQIFLEEKRSDKIANTFCRECVDERDAELLKCLVDRDARVLVLRDGKVAPGPAFKGKTTQNSSGGDESAAEQVESPAQGTIQWPEGISYRVRNLFLLNADLHGELDKWLGDAPDEETESE
jgi:hypothetical protein